LEISLLSVDTTLSFLASMSWTSHLQDHRVVNKAIDGSGSGDLVLEDAIPLRKNEIARKDDAAAFIALREEGEEDLHLIARLLNIAKIIKDDSVKLIKALYEALKLKLSLGSE
jgi:hypothetical protein